MKLNLQSKSYKALAKLIEERCTGGLGELSNKLGVSRTQAYNMLEELKTMDLDIKFDSKIRSYYILNNKKIEVTTPIKIISLQ